MMFCSIFKGPRCRGNLLLQKWWKYWWTRACTQSRASDTSAPASRPSMHFQSNVNITALQQQNKEGLKAFRGTRQENTPIAITRDALDCAKTHGNSRHKKRRRRARVTWLLICVHLNRGHFSVQSFTSLPCSVRHDPQLFPLMEHSADFTTDLGERCKHGARARNYAWIWRYSSHLFGQNRLSLQASEFAEINAPAEPAIIRCLFACFCDGPLWGAFRGRWSMASRFNIIRTNLFFMVLFYFCTHK